MPTSQQQHAAGRNDGSTRGSDRSAANDAFAIVAVGVSADGSESLREFFGALPPNGGIAYILIQQAAPPYRALCAPELGAMSALAFVDVEDGMRVEPDHAYVVPPDKEYALESGSLRLLGDKTYARPLDRFLRSLAEDRTVLARGVVLSGSGLDAAEGLLAIRRHGGLSFAQDPITARFSGMSRHAIASHAVDYVLSPKRIAEQLVARSPRPEAHSRAPRGRRRTRLTELRWQLAKARVRHKAMLERHATSHEELTVANAELTAANEELHTINNELQESRAQMVSVGAELQRRNEDLDAANDDLMNVLTSVEIPIVIVDSERRIRRYLPGASGLINVTPQDVGRPLADLSAKIDAPQLDAWIAQAIGGAQPADFEARDRDGAWRRLQIRPYRTHDGRIDGALVSMIDIDALKRLLDGANSARDRARAMFETVPLPLVVLDARQRVAAANRSFHEFFGITRESARGSAFIELGSPRGRATLQARLQASLADGTPVHDCEVEYDVGLDVTRLVSLDAVRVQGERGAHSLLLVLQDVTARRRREYERARAHAERMQRLLNEAGELLLSESLEALDSHSALEKLARMAIPALGDVCLIDVVGLDGSIEPAALAGCTREQPVDASIAARVERDADDAVARVIRGGSSVLEPELDAAALGRIGGTRAALLRACGASSYLCVPLRGRGEVLGALSLARANAHYGDHDIALAEGLGQRAGMALNTARLYRAAHEAIRLRDEFLGIASHELRTPLTALSLQLETVQWLLPPSARAPDGRSGLGDKIGHALRYTRRLARLIDSLLVVSRLMSGQFTLQLEDVDLGEIARDVVERLRADAARARCTLDVRQQPGVRGHWDPLRLDQVVTNLITNAFRYAPGSHVRVGVSADERRATLVVEDDGPGIALERLGRIFERYEIAGERSTSGLGLGLYITRQIAEAHAGSVRVESAPGHGTRFVIELPIAGPPDERGPSEAAP
jgi:PAS domain S-box-containing protein